MQGTAVCVCVRLAAAITTINVVILLTGCQAIKHVYSPLGVTNSEVFDHVRFCSSFCARRFCHLVLKPCFTPKEFGDHLLMLFCQLLGTERLECHAPHQVHRIAVRTNDGGKAMVLDHHRV